MARRRKMRCQPRVPGGREAMPSCVLPSTRGHVLNDAIQHGVSSSWVVASIVAHHYRDREQIDFRTARRKGEIK